MSADNGKKDEQNTRKVITIWRRYSVNLTAVRWMRNCCVCVQGEWWM